VDAQDGTVIERPRSCLSKTSLEALDRLSATNSNISLEKWLDTPSTYELLSAALSNYPDGSVASNTKPLGQKVVSRAVSSTSVRSMASQRPTRSLAGSESSMGSKRSYNSVASRRSVDSRGFRRGRRQWKQHKRASKCQDSDHEPIPDLHQGIGIDNSRYFCTWQTCDSTYKTRYEWSRHEEAVHYHHRRWVCCYEVTNDMNMPECFLCKEKDLKLVHLAENHFRSCTGRAEKDRTFWRSDQLVQHVKRVHGGQALPKAIQSAWASKNPWFNLSYLNCGFCGLESRTWEERQAHVSRHIELGCHKESWWPERQFTPLRDPQKPLQWSKPAESDRYGDELWSCRFLEDYRCLGDWFCVLCGHEFDDEEDRKAHAATHKLRGCSQYLYTRASSFINHLTAEHNTTTTHGFILPFWHFSKSLIYQHDQTD
jgi:hypothetical protein